jgi:uncharacterized membrane protein YkvA (DUF1232 family)
MAGQSVVPYDPEKLKRDQARVERGFWKKIRKHIRRVPFVEDLIAVYYCALDPATPLQVKAVLFGALAYFVLPADLLPDFIAWFGFTDDAAVLYAAIRAIAPHLKDRHREQARIAIDRIAGEGPASHSA